MNFSYNPLLVILSVLVAIQASYVGLSLAQHISRAFALNRRFLIAGSALTLAFGIWGMHFIGMLAVKADFSLNYDVLPTLISFLVCVLVTGIAIYLASLRAMRKLIFAAGVMGLGIVAMHYIGMIAVHSSAHMVHNPLFILASIVMAIAASGLALWLAFVAGKAPPLLFSAGVLGCAISGMHYIAMAGTTLSAMAGMSEVVSSAISGDFLAVIVSIVAFSISGIFMLALIPNRTTEISEREKWKSAEVPALSVTLPETGIKEPEPSSDIVLSVDAIVGARPVIESLPFERNGSRFQIATTEILSVHANAHYTYLFNGREDLFCPLSITEIASRLPKEIFFRAHRSHIVNLAFVLHVRKAADAGVAELNSPVRRTVPISRTRVAVLRQEVSAYQDISTKSPFNPN